MSYKFGYVSIIGKPNAGKSTLINALIEKKVSIVSSKPQTTRNNILGIKNGHDYQVVFIDTPGIHASNNKLDKYMMKNVRTAIDGVNVIIYILDAYKSVSDAEFKYIEDVAECSEKFILVLNKTDIAKFDKTYPIINKFKNINSISEIIPISALKGNNIELIMDTILNYLPSSDNPEYEFPTDEYTDKSTRFLVSEIVREKALYCLEQEIPHGIAINVSVFIDKPNFCEIEVEIIAEKDSHKNIIIGKQGTMCKKIGSMSRLEIEKLLNKKVLLKIWVRVKKDWRNNSGFLSEYGYNSDEI